YRATLIYRNHWDRQDRRVRDELSHGNLPALVPHPKYGQIRIGGIGGILACNGKQTANGDQPVLRKVPLKRRLHTDNREAVSLPCVEVVSVRPPGEPVQGAEFDVVPEPVLVVKYVLENQARVDDVAGVGVCSAVFSGRSIGVEHGCADANGFKVFSRHESLSQPIFAKSRSGKSPEWSEPTGRLLRIGPAAGG